jgi:hypothetical protein
MCSGNHTRRAFSAAAGVLTLLAGTGVASTLWEFKFNETGLAPANTGTGSLAPVLITRRAFSWPFRYDLHGADGSGVSGLAGDRALNLSGINTNGGLYTGHTAGPQLNVAYTNCTAIQNLTTLTLSGWFNALYPIEIATYSGNAKLMSFYQWSSLNGGNNGFGVQISTTIATKNQIYVILDKASLYFDVTAIMGFNDTNKWYFWAATYDGTLSSNNAKLYMGTPGSAVIQVGAAQTANSGSLETNTSDFSLNGGSGSGTIKGFQDNVRVDNVVMSLAELETRRILDAGANMALYGRGTLIPNGNGTPIPGDATDFGNAMPASLAVTNVFAITNWGADLLLLTGAPPVVLSGNTGDFTVIVDSLSTNIAARSSTPFKVVFAPTTTGTRTGLVSIANSVASKNPYTFTIKGNGITVEPVIGAMGKGRTIGTGDLSPSGADGTDFGAADITGMAITNTFAITNSGLALLTLTGGTPVTLSGDTGDFSVDTAGMASSVAAGASTTFRIIFNPGVHGLRTALVHLASDDAHLNPFTFFVQGTGQKPLIVVSGNGTPITSGDITPAMADGTDFGGTDLMLGPTLTNVFAITNSGPGVLLLTGETPVSLSGNVSDFTVCANPATTLVSGASTSFKVVFAPTMPGIRTGTVTIANNDVDRTPYVFGIQGFAGVATNSIPYGETFESYPVGYELAFTNGWSARFSPMGVVTTNPYAGSYTGAFPLQGPHQKTFRIDGLVTNTFSATTHSNVWVDMILESKSWTNNTLPAESLLTHAQFALCITTNHHVAVWNCLAPPSPTCGWTELLDTDVPENSFVRVTVEMDYVRDSTNYFHYRVWVNETASVSPKIWYAAAKTNLNSLSRITCEGLFHMDDLSVQTLNPFGALSIFASSLGYGSIVPAGTVTIPYGSSTSFTNTPSLWYHIGTLTVDGSPIEALPVLTFTNVRTSHTIEARFAPDTVLSNTPSWWLAEANPAWTNNLNAAATNDQDRDGFTTWEEYIAGTNPTNPASVFGLQIVWSNNAWQVSVPTIEPGAQYEGLNRYYSLESCTDLLSGNWAPLPGLTDIRASGSVLICTNLTGATNRYFKGKVRLAP